MVKLKFDKEKEKWIELPNNSSEGIYLDGFLKNKLDNVKMIISKGWDAAILIDGFERSGKSTLGMTAGYYLSDTKLTINNFAKGLSDAAHKIRILPEKSILIVDEGSLVFNSRDSMNKANVRLGKILDVVGQKNLIFIIILPSFFNLVKDIAVRRSRFMIHVYSDPETLDRGNFAYFGERAKSVLYNHGKKNFGSYAHPTADFVGKFTDFKPDFYDEYIKLKNQSLMEALEIDDSPQKKEDDVLRAKMELIYTYYTNNPKMTFTSIGKAFSLDRTTIARYVKIISKEAEIKASSGTGTGSFL